MDTNKDGQGHDGRKPSRRRWIGQCVGTGAALAVPGLLRAQAAWPTKPLRIVVPFAAGGATDALARVLGERIAPRLGQPWTVDNRAGAGGVVGTDAVAKAPPDGHTWVLSLSTSLLINAFLYEKLPYNPLRDLSLVSLLALGTVTLAAHPSLPVRTGPELLDYARRNKGKLSYGSWGVGSQAHLVGAHISRITGADISHVPYKGEAQMLQDLLAGQVQFSLCSALGAKPHAEAGKLRLIGVTGEQRMETLPDLPTLVEQGLRDDAFRLVGWLGFAGPTGVPGDTVQQMSRELAAALAQPDVRARVVGMGFTPVGSTPEAFMAFYKRDAPAWEQLVKDSGARLE